MQRKQMTTLQNNIKVIAIDGKFDDCQRLVKKAFSRSITVTYFSFISKFNQYRKVTPAIGILFLCMVETSSGRVDEKAVFSVPSGNFGNLMGGLIAGKMGLPVKQFIISTNENNEVPEFLRTG